MTTRIEIKDIFGKVLFAYECEENTIKKTVEEAVRQNISLCVANLYSVNLRYADLSGANLRKANLNSANLYGAKLCDADLNGADLSGADLCNAILNDANLNEAHLINAKVCGANLCDSYLDYANLRYADLNGADLRYANLRWSNLNGANLRNANLRNAILFDANLLLAKNTPFIPLACPSEGSFVGWKKVNNHIIKLFIPEDAKRISATTNKCRCDKAKVLEITNLETNEHVDEIVNENYAKCVYKVGEMVYPDEFDENRWNECSNGIHFFVNKQEAIDY